MIQSILALAALLACQRGARAPGPDPLAPDPVAEPSPPPAPEPAVDSTPTLAALKPAISTGDAVEIWIRDGLDNPFVENPAPFERHSTVQAVEAPFGGGGITGTQLWTAAVAHAGDRGTPTVRCKGLQVGQPAITGGSVSVEAADNEYFNDYVGRTPSGELVVLLEVLIAP